MARKGLTDLGLGPDLRAALEDIRGRVTAQFDIDRLVLFGSAVWGRPDEESDVDLLIVVNNKVDLETENCISRVVFEVNLKYDTNISELIVDREAWDYGLASAMPIHEEIEKRGIRVEEPNPQSPGDPFLRNVRPLLNCLPSDEADDESGEE